MKRIAIFLVMILMAALLSACGTQTTTAPAAPTTTSAPAMGKILTDVKNTGILKVGAFGNRPPWYFQRVDANGKKEISGFEYYMINDIAKEVGKKVGREVKVEILETDVAGVLAAIQAGKVHFSFSLAGTPERKKNMDFSTAYHRSLQVIAIRVADKDNPKFKLENKLKGVKIASIQASSTTVSLKEQYPGCEVLDLTSAADQLLSLANGKCDAAVFNEKIGILYSKANPSIMVVPDLSFKVPLDRELGSSLAFQYGNDDFKALCDAYITRILNDGTFNGFEKKAISLLDDPSVLDSFTTKNLIDTKK